MGTSVLRQRLIGPSVAAYYPRKVGTYQDFKKLYAEWESIDIDEFEREEHVAGYVITAIVWNLGIWGECMERNIGIWRKLDIG